MNNNVLDMLADMPRGTERAVVIYPTRDGNWAVRWVGVTAEQAATLLYQVADATVDQEDPAAQGVATTRVRPDP
ncbi:hypothetical protein [Lysobacter sp. HA35]